MANFLEVQQPYFSRLFLLLLVKPKFSSVKRNSLRLRSSTSIQTLFKMLLLLSTGRQRRILQKLMTDVLKKLQHYRYLSL